MDREQLLPHETVLVRNSEIAQIGPTGYVRIPKACDTIDGCRRYLIPGLTDSHAHLPLTGTADQRLVLQLLLRNGITTAINMEGSREILALRNQIGGGAVFGPKLYTTGPFIQ
jgi:imidazolonepropionase-like amidohydrolase